ncbi:hypothetical protein [Photobacterium damselae]|uniref:hypothetical protein n=1 Tax=Photobacterium damselae TaxID=38293 RepID=UPI001EFE5FE7|nr:hypothetical protein [Photobacterium damselae]MCG9780468.1 hypothetical protein [Photobacterium damselae]
MNNLEITTHEKLPHIRYMSIDTLVDLKFDANSKELTVSATTTRTTASVQIEQTIAASELVHSARISDEGHVFPILRTADSRVYISFDELKGYLAACELCEIEPEPEVCENARAAELES